MRLGLNFSLMEAWEENIVGWTSLGLLKLVETAISVPVWEYVGLALVLTSIWLYRTLDFHFVEDLFHGFRGEIPRLHHSPESDIAAHILPKCKILKQRLVSEQTRPLFSHPYYYLARGSLFEDLLPVHNVGRLYRATPWLSSPHLQTAFLHFNGRPPPIKYHRQLYITPDKGTIALDWVKPPLSEDEELDLKQQNPELDAAPIVIIIPGLTSDSNDPYLKHIAYSSAMQGWRTVVSNHRGLGGVSMTSDQFYNAGWTEDLRRIINFVHGKYPQAPLFAIGNSIGANILVKYLGEEGASTPVGAAAAVCCPWDLLVCDRFMSRKGVQKLYNRVLAVGLLQYAKMHQTVLGRIADWNDVSKTKTIREFDHHCTRHTADYETVDTYYRRCSSADFLARVAVPLFCFHALDDPVCTREAIPWDEIIANPNVVMAATKHGGHLAYFEGLTAHSIWWSRALTEYMTVMMASNLMCTSQKLSGLHLMKNGQSDVDKAPYLHFSSSGQVAAEDLQPLSPANKGEIAGQEENADEMDVIIEKDSTLEDKSQDEHASTSREIGTEDEAVGEVVTLSFKDSSELSALQSALSQLLQQLQDFSSVNKEYRHENFSHTASEDHHEMEPAATAAKSLSAHMGESTVLALQECSIRAVEVPVRSSLMSPLKDCREVAASLAFSCKYNNQLTASKDSTSSLKSLIRNKSGQTKQKVHTQRGSNKQTLEALDASRQGFAIVAAQNRRTLWLLAYIALVTTCPLIGSALFFRWRGVVTNFTKRMLK